MPLNRKPTAKGQPYCHTDSKHATPANGVYGTFLPDVRVLRDHFAFGMEMTGQAWNSPDYRYGFQGQERDDEVKGTGNSYDFGARLYDPRVGRWWSRDPLEAKYPSVSPYAIVANSPMIHVDPNGKEIVLILSRDSKGKVKEAVRYYKGKLYTTQGKEYRGAHPFAIEVQRALNDVRSADIYLEAVVTDIEDSPVGHYIDFKLNAKRAYVTTNSRDPEGRGTHMVLSDEDFFGKELDSGEESTLGSTLAHELQHVIDYDTDENDESYDSQINVQNKEIKAVNLENRYRANRNMQLRTHYGKDRIIPREKLEDPCKQKIQ